MIVGLVLALVLMVLGAAGFILFIPAAVGLAVLVLAVRTRASRRPVVVAVVAAGVTAVVLYVALLGFAISAIPEDVQDAM